MCPFASPEGMAGQSGEVLWGAQEGPTEKQLVREAMEVIKDRKASADDRALAVEDLLGLGSLGPMSLARYLKPEIEKGQKRNAKEASKFMKAFDKAAMKLIDGRLDRETLAKVEEHRKLLLRLGRSDALTKDQIKGQSDKAMEALISILTVEADDLWQAEPALKESWDGVLGTAEELERMHGDWERAKKALVYEPDGERLVARLKAPKETPVPAAEYRKTLERHVELARPMGAGDRLVFEKNAALAPSILPEETAGIRFWNLRLVLIGLPAQAVDVKLCEACRDHSKDMAEQKFFAHESPVPGKKTFSDRAGNFGTTSNSENIARGASTGADSIRQWWYSPGHHRNLMRGSTRVGLGRHGVHWTQNFGN